MVYCVKELRKVDVHNPAMPVIHYFQCFKNCLLCTPIGPESVAVVVELLLKYRSEHLCYRLLYKAVYHRWHSKVPCSTVWLWYLHPSDRLRLVLPCPQLFPDAFAVFRKVCTKSFDGHSVDTCRSFVSDDLQICRIEIVFA